MAAVAVKYPAFRELGAEVLAVSVDSVDTHRKWQEEELVRMVKGGALFPLCSDPQGEIGKLFGVYDPGPEEDLRATFIIDPEGKIQALEILAGPAGPARISKAWIFPSGSMINVARKSSSGPGS